MSDLESFVSILARAGVPFFSGRREHARTISVCNESVHFVFDGLGKLSDIEAEPDPVCDEPMQDRIRWDGPVDDQ